ncbi:MAG: hypothetical protein MK108_19445, partial [Mariniblastus sp.]|nr:hypothetical protein [Mariniblastus sp.]
MEVRWIRGGGRSAASALLVLAILGAGGGCSDVRQDPTRHERDPSAAKGEAVSESALLEAIRIGDPVDRSARLSSLLAGLGPGSVDSVRDFFQANLSQLHPLDAGLLFQWWSREEPRVALEWLEDNDKLYDIGFFQRLGLASWAGQDFDAAREFLEVRVVPFETLDLQVRRDLLLHAAYDSGSPQL